MENSEQKKKGRPRTKEEDQKSKKLKQLKIRGRKTQNSNNVLFENKEISKIFNMKKHNCQFLLSLNIIQIIKVLFNCIKDIENEVILQIRRKNDIYFLEVQNNKESQKFAYSLQIVNSVFQFFYVDEEFMVKHKLENKEEQKEQGSKVYSASQVETMVRVQIDISNIVKFLKNCNDKNTIFIYIEKQHPFQLVFDIFYDKLVYKETSKILELHNTLPPFNISDYLPSCMTPPFELGSEIIGILKKASMIDDLFFKIVMHKNNTVINISNNLHLINEYHNNGNYQEIQYQFQIGYNSLKNIYNVKDSSFIEIVYHMSKSQLVYFCNICQNFNNILVQFEVPEKIQDYIFTEKKKEELQGGLEKSETQKRNGEQKAQDCTEHENPFMTEEEELLPLTSNIQQGINRKLVITVGDINDMYGSIIIN